MEQVAVLLVTVTGCSIVFMLGRALAERLRPRQPDPGPALEELEAMRAHLSSLQAQLSDLAERQDFAERVLAQMRERVALPASREER
jgi:hypothetical protein